MRQTEISPLQGLVREPDLEKAALFGQVELGHGQAGAVYGNGVADMTVAEKGGRVCNREGAAILVEGDGGDGAEVLYLWAMRGARVVEKQG
jgi:hypothetical protein